MRSPAHSTVPRRIVWCMQLPISVSCTARCTGANIGSEKTWHPCGCKWGCHNVSEFGFAAVVVELVVVSYEITAVVFRLDNVDLPKISRM
jgi:hypothetical protein